MMFSIPLLWLYHLQFSKGQNADTFTIGKLFGYTSLVIATCLYLFFDRKAVEEEAAEKAERNASYAKHVEYGGNQDKDMNTTGELDEESRGLMASNPTINNILTTELATSS